MTGWYSSVYTEIVYPYLTGPRGPGPGASPGLRTLHLVGSGGKFFPMDPVIFGINFSGVKMIGADAIIIPDADWSTLCQLASLAYTGK